MRSLDSEYQYYLRSVNGPAETVRGVNGMSCQVTRTHSLISYLGAATIDLLTNFYVSALWSIKRHKYSQVLSLLSSLLRTDCFFVARNIFLVYNGRSLNGFQLNDLIYFVRFALLKC